MLHPRKMSRLLIAASRDRQDTIIRELYAHRVFHIETFVEDEDEENAGLRIGTPLSGAGDASGRLVKVRSLESTFGVLPEEVVPSARTSTARLRDAIDRELPRISSEVEELLAERASLDAMLKDREQQIRELAPFATAPIPLELYRGYETITVSTGRAARDPAITVPHEKFYAVSKEGNFLAVFARKEERGAVEAALAGAGFVPLAVPKGNGLPATLVDEHIQAISKIRDRTAAIGQRLEVISRERREFLAACEELLTIDVEQAEAPLRFATTDQAFLIEGWVPVEEVERLKSGVALTTEGKAFIAEVPGDIHHQAPVEYNNPGFAQPTQLIIDSYSRPRYDELDPTVFISIIFPLFFGIILGDVGYGLILLAVSVGLRNMITGRDARWLLAVMRNGSISSIIFGVLFSEFFGFGFDQFGIHWEPVLFKRHLNIGAEAGAHGGGPDITGLLLFAIWIGIAQITLGRILSAANHYRHHGVRGLLPQFGWIGAMWGILLLIWSMASLPLMPNLTGYPAIALGLSLPGLAGVVMILVGIVAIASEAALELIELPTIISHTMSYARLVAVGLSSVAIAMVVNFIAIGLLIEPQLEELSVVGVIFIILGVLVLVFGHLMNTALGLIGGSLQSLRLQYVEFFTKFYKGGGEKYSPFGIVRKFTED